MTDKDLKKLSRLELLELLLSQSRENERLREDVERLKGQPYVGTMSENAIEDISKATEQLNSALYFADRVARQLQNIACPAKDDNREACDERQSYPRVPNKEAQQDNQIMAQAGSDRNLYWRIMNFYSANPAAMSELPVEIQKDIIHRLKVIKNAK